MKLVYAKATTVAALIAMCSVITPAIAQETNNTTTDADFATEKSSRAGRVGAQYGKKGGVLKFCLDEDKCDYAIKMKLEKLREVTSSTNGTQVQKAENFNKVEFNLSEPIRETVGENGTERIRLSYAAVVQVGKKNDNKFAKFDMQTMIYLNASTALNGNQTIDIPKDSLKFSINVTDWPFESVNNSLAFGIRLQVKARGGKKGNKNPEKKKGKGRDGKVSRYELGDGTFMDTPEQCVIDGEVATVESSSVPFGNDGVELDWVFPHFAKYVYYDPVMGSEEDLSTADGGDDSSVEAGTSAASSAYVVSTTLTLIIATITSMLL